jgi:Flp pilus assembly protein TadG
MNGLWVGLAKKAPGAQSPVAQTRPAAPMRKSLTGLPMSRLPTASSARLSRTIAHLRNGTGMVRAFAANQSGATMILVALCLPALVGAMGLSAEVSYWYLRQRAMQNAADAAAIAAATNGSSGYAAEAKAVAAQYGFRDGSGNIVVAVSNPATAAGCTSNCYSVTISDKVPLFLSEVVGYLGTATANKKGATGLSAAAVATSLNAVSYCILALAASGAQGITSNGVPNANLQGCDVMSNTSATCNGHNLNANVGSAHSTNNGCGIVQNSNVPVVADPYSGLASQIPADPCGGSYPQEPAKNKDPPLPSSTNQWSGTKSLSYYMVCGDLQLTGDTTISAQGGTLLVIANGQLDINGHTLQTANGSGLTVVFTGSNNASYQHVPSDRAGGGTLDIAAPSSGAWSGIAIYQDPNLTANVDVSYAGNSPTWEISGMIYLPHASVTFSGAVNKSSHGSYCFGMVIDNITINGTADIFAGDDQCSSSGLVLPSGGARGTLTD